MYKCTNSQLQATFNNYFKLITDVHSNNTKQTETRHSSSTNSKFKLRN